MTRIPFGNAGSLEILRFVRDFARKKRRLRRNRLCIVLLGAQASLPTFFPKMIIIAGKDAGAPSIFKLIINCQRNGLKRPFPSSQRSGRCIPAPDAGLRSKTSRTSAFPNRIWEPVLMSLWLTLKPRKWVSIFAAAKKTAGCRFYVPYPYWFYANNSVSYVRICVCAFPFTSTSRCGIRPLVRRES